MGDCWSALVMSVFLMVFLGLCCIRMPLLKFCLLIFVSLLGSNLGFLLGVFLALSVLVVVATCGIVSGVAGYSVFGIVFRTKFFSASTKHSKPSNVTACN